MRRRTLLISTMCAFLVAPAASQTPNLGPVLVTRDSGGTMQLDLGPGISVNKGSTLQREFIAIHDASLPVDVLGTPGIMPAFENRDYRYKAAFIIEVKQPISAVEVRFLTFDLWGDHLHTLSMTEVKDFPPGTTPLSATWGSSIFPSENEVSKYYASIAFIARARVATGKVFEASDSVVLGEARRLSKKFAPENLLPKPPRG